MAVYLSIKPKACCIIFQNMISIIFAVVVATFAVSSAHPMEKRQANGPWSLYAYGSNIDGLPIFYADGKYLSPLKRSLLILFGEQAKLRSVIWLCQTQPTSSQFLVSLELRVLMKGVWFSYSDVWRQPKHLGCSSRYHECHYRICNIHHSRCSLQHQSVGIEWYWLNGLSSHLYLPKWPGE